MTATVCTSEKQQSRKGGATAARPAAALPEPIYHSPRATLYCADALAINHQPSTLNPQPSPLNPQP